MGTDAMNLIALADEICGDGPLPALDQDKMDGVEALAGDARTAAALAARLRVQEDQAHQMLDDLVRGVHRAVEAPDDDHSRFVTELSLIGSVLVERRKTLRSPRRSRL